MDATSYTITAECDQPYADTVERVRAELAEEGFGVLSEIDVQATLRQKLGVEVEPYVILGACNPPFAHRALTAEPDLGALLPCNVVVRRESGRSIVSAVDAGRMLALVGNDDLAPIAAEIGARLERVVARVAAA